MHAGDTPTSKKTQLCKQDNGIIYLDTPDLFDSKVQQTAAKKITNALKQKGSFQVFFVVTMESGKIRSIDLTTMWLVLMNALDIKFFGVIINKLSKKDYACLSQHSLKLQGELKECASFFLLEDGEILHHRGSNLKCKELEQFVAEVPWVDIDPHKVKEIPDDDISFQRFEKMLQIYPLFNFTTNKHKCLEIVDHLRLALDLAVSFICLILAFYLITFSPIIQFQFI